MIWIVSIFFGILPGIIWLLFYLREDVHPEPKRLILQVFILGALSAPIALVAEGVLNKILNNFGDKVSLWVLLVLMAAIEEIVKYLVVWFRMSKDKDLDEPIDAMVYMVVAALGFATAENIFFSSSAFADSAILGIGVISARFIGSTLLHTLSSSIVGYGMALNMHSFPQKRLFLMVSVFIEAILLHALFNYVILSTKNILGFVASIVLLIVFFIFINMAYKKIRKMSLLK
ncbi:MAG: PrsW family intramembrane metalloprotease [Patescibacteria group bacterium]